jgi:hypothetical protein
LLTACPHSGALDDVVDDDAADDDAADDDASSDVDPPEHVPGSLLEEVPEAEHPHDEFAPLCALALECEHEILDTPKQPCWLRVQDHGGDTGYEGWAGVELRGRSSSGFPKGHYGVELWREGRTLIPRDATWSYLDTGVGPGDGWVDLAYDDAGWPSGAAPLGYGGVETTEVSYGGDDQAKHITTWFRHTFELTALPVAPVAAVMRDDGVVIHVNGVEAARSNMPDGPLTDQTLAATTVGGDAEIEYFEAALPAELFVEGPNVVAVEAHQAAATSSDLAFALWLGDGGGDVDVDLFGMGPESDWVINGNYADRALFRNKLSFDLYQSLGGTERYATQTHLCELTLNGEWLGVYTLGERIKRGDDRVVIEEDLEDLGGSFIVKNDDGGGCFFTSAATYGEWCLVYPRSDGVSESALAGITATVQAFEDAVTGPDPADPDTGVFAHMDMDSAVDWLLLQELSKNNDAYFMSIYMVKDLDGPLMLVPWDLDLAYGGYPVNNCEPEGWILYRSAMIDAFMATPEFQQRSIERWIELRGAELSEDSLLQRIEAYREIVGDAAYANFEVWPMDEIDFSWEGTNWLCPVSSYDEEMARLEEWLIDRLAWMDASVQTFGLP